MENIMGKLRNLDAYRKINEDFYSRTLSGGLITLASSIVMLLLFLSELQVNWLVLMNFGSGWVSVCRPSNLQICLSMSSLQEIQKHLDCSKTCLRSEQLRCTFRAYDVVDEITAAFSIAFNPTGTKIFARYNKSVRVFDVHHPGRDFEQYSTLQGNKEGQTCPHL